MIEEVRRVTNLRWRNFLATQEGQEGLAFVREQAPRVTKGDADGMVFDAGRIEGYLLCLDRIVELIGSGKEAKQENFDNA